MVQREFMVAIAAWLPRDEIGDHLPQALLSDTAKVIGGH